MDAKEIALQTIARIAGVDQAGLRADTELVGDLGIDSPRALQLVVELEDALGIEIADEALPRLNRVGDVLAEIERLAG